MIKVLIWDLKRWLFIVAFGVLQKFSLEAQYVHPFNTYHHKSHDFSMVTSFSKKLISLPHSSSENISPKFLLPQVELNRQVSQLSILHSDSNSLKSSMEFRLVELNLSQTPFPGPDHLSILPDLLLNFDPDDFSEKEPFLHSIEFHFLKELSAFTEFFQWEGFKEPENYNFLTSYITFEFEHSIKQHLSPAMLYSGTKKYPDTHSPNLQTDYSTSKDTQLQGQKFKIQHLFHDYPQFLPKSNSAPTFYYDIFSSSPFETVAQVDPNDSLIEEKLAELDHSLPSNRQRRLTTYIWEMTDFSDYNKNTVNDFLDLTGYGGDDLKIVLKPLSSGTVGAGTAENLSATQGVATNMPVFPDAGIWSPDSRTYNDFMKITGTLPNSIFIDASAMKYYMNWHYGDWDISTTAVSLNHYDLVYYSAVPEPSTYIMTGALFCVIAYNRESRRSFKKLFSFFYSRHSRKENSTEIENQVS